MGRRQRENSRSLSRSRSRSGGRESKKRRKDRKSDRSKHRRKERSVSSHSSSDDGDRNKNSIKNGSKISDFSTGKPQDGSGASNGSESLSVAETNALRAKLGLAPLEINKPSTDENLGTLPEDGQKLLEDGVVWAPASSLTHDKKTEKMREKLAVLKDKREIEKKRLKNIATLGEDDDEIAASDWVEKSRRLQEKKIKEEKEEKQLNALGDEFGLDYLLDEDLDKVSKKSKYSSTSLTGLKVEHSVDKFLEGQETILTLKDKKILEEDDEDVLINLNIKDSERHAKNVELKRKGKDYQAFDHEEFDEFGLPKMQSLLGKYDDVIDGEHTRTFKIGADGEIDDEEARYRQMVRKELESKTVSLAMPEAKLAHDYYTQEEAAAKFTKRKRKTKKVRNRLTADDLLKEMTEDSSRDHGSRLSRSRKQEIEDSEMLSGDELVGDWNGTTAPIKLEDDVNIKSSISKTGVIAQNLAKKSDAALRIAEKLRNASKIEEQEDEKQKKLVFDNTAEFCRAVSELNKQEVKVKTEPESMKSQLDRELEEFAMKDESSDNEEMDVNKGWDNIERDNRTLGEQIGSKTKIKSALTEEPEVNAGVLGALMLAKHKGYLEKEGGTRSMGQLTQAGSKINPSYAIEDKSAKHIEDKWSRKEDRDRVSLREFRDDNSYRPNFNLEYYDSSGRKLNEKEAFRDLSHKFHGKGSGKLKTFKRMKKIEEERKLKGMSSDDTPLHMVATMREKQKSLGAAHIVLSGMGQNLASSGNDFKK